MNRFHKGSAAFYLCVFTGLVILAPFFFVSIYNHPLGDDYWCTALVREYGYWKAQRMLYAIVPPRYTGLALSCLTPLSFGNFWGYALIPIGAIFLTAIVVGRLVRSFLAGLLFTVAYLAVIPGIGEGIYWASALSVYQLGLLLFLLWIGCLQNWYDRGKRRPRLFFFTCLCLIGFIGCNEIIASIGVLVLLVLGLFLIKYKRRVDALWVVQLCLSVGCLGFILLFKGTRHRYILIRTADSGRWIHSAAYSFLGVGYYISKCLINPYFWALGIAAFKPFCRWVRKPVVARSGWLRHPNYVLGTWALILLLIPFTIIFLTGQVPPLRISNMIVFFFLLGLFYLGALLSNLDLMGLRSGWKLPQFMGERVRAVLVVALLAVGGLSRNNVSGAAGDLVSGRARRYDREMRQRYALIRQCVLDTCRVPALQDTPRTLRYDPADNDPHISEYFHKVVMVVEKKK